MPEFADKLTLVEQSAPGTPASGKMEVYAKADGKLYILNDSGVEFDLTATAGGLEVKVWDSGSSAYVTDTDVKLFVDLVGGNDPKTATGGRNASGDVWFDPTPTLLKVPFVHPYLREGAFTTSTVFLPFPVDESFGLLKLTRATTKLTSGTATFKIKINGTDEVTGIPASSGWQTTDFTDESAFSDLAYIELVATAASSAVDLSFSFHFVREYTL